MPELAPVPTAQYVAILRECGYAPEVDADGDIQFKDGKGTFFLSFEKNDPTYIRLIYPNFWKLPDPKNRLLALEAANHATQKMRVAKFFVLGETAWGTVEMYTPDATFLKRKLPGLIKLVYVGGAEFLRVINGEVKPS